MEDEIKELIESVLHIPVFLEGDSIIFPGAVISLLPEVPRLHGDGKGVSYVNDVEISLYYNDRTMRDIAAGELMAALNAIVGYTSAELERYYDTTAKKHRAVFRFETINKEV